MVNFEPEGSVKAFLARLIDAAADGSTSNDVDFAEGISTIAADVLGVSRQTIHKHLTAMVKQGLIEPIGRTSGTGYKLKLLDSRRESFRIGPELQEDVVWRQVFAGPLRGLSQNVFDICSYGLTEMLNNAIGHSGGAGVSVALSVSLARVHLRVIDDGIGVFRKVKEGLGLADDREAILELSKGKVTTDPQQHTGQGIFFTSRVFDQFILAANNLNLVHLAPDDEDDWLIEDDKDANRSGTSVSMSASVWSHRTLKEVFDKYASGDDPGFSKTHIPVKLLLVGEENLVSRSQAKRLLARFSRFEEVMLDFEGVQQVGQAFTDEIFRVFAKEHPNIRLVTLRTNQQINDMIARAKESAL